MGQYQQWLRYREVERQLRMQIESLEAELAELEARARSFEETDASGYGDTSNNELLRLLSLVTRLDVHTSSREHEPAATNGATSSPIFMNETTEAREPGAAESFSPTFFGWGLPPDFGPQAGPAATQQPAFEGPSASPQPSPLPQPGIELLPEDIAAFFDEYSQTDPQLGLPWWQQPPVASPSIHSSAPIDQQGLRNKHEIERWIERWRRLPAQPSPPVQPKNQEERSHE